MALEMKYFVLKPKAKSLIDPYARASQDAMQAYAESILDTDPELANSLIIWVRDEVIAQARLEQPDEG